MSLIQSSMMPLGTEAPHFELPDTVSGKLTSLPSIKSYVGTVVMFICNHCPYVIHVQEEVVNMAKDYQPKGISFVAISSNDIKNYPQDAPDLMAEHARRYGFSFPYLYDETQEVAKAYQAECTPDFFLFDQEGKCIYRGRMDASTPGNQEPVSGADLRDALDSLLGKSPISQDQKPSMGCNIKWK